MDRSWREIARNRTVLETDIAWGKLIFGTGNLVNFAAGIASVGQLFENVK